MSELDEESVEVVKQAYLKNLKRIVIGIVVLIGLVIFGVGGKLYMENKRFNDEMTNIVKSDQAKQEIEVGLKNLDSKALTSKGKIKSYKIDYDTIRHNPMGAIMFEVIINDDKTLTAEFDLNKHSEILKVGGIGLSEKLADLIYKVNYE